MIATLGCEFIYDHDNRPIPKFVVRVYPDGNGRTNCVTLHLSEATGSDDELVKVLRELFKQFLAKIPKQSYTVTMHITFDCMAPMASPFMRKVMDQMKDAYRPHQKNHSRPMQRELQLKFSGFKVNVVCVAYQQ